MGICLSLAKGYSGSGGGVGEAEECKGSTYGRVGPVVNSDFQENEKASLNSHIFAIFPEIQAILFFSLGAMNKNAYKLWAANKSFASYIS